MYWALGMGHGAWGIGHWALGIGHWALGIRYSTLASPASPIPHSLLLIPYTQNAATACGNSQRQLVSFFFTIPLNFSSAI